MNRAQSIVLLAGIAIALALAVVGFVVRAVDWCAEMGVFQRLHAGDRRVLVRIDRELLPAGPCREELFRDVGAVLGLIFHRRHVLPEPPVDGSVQLKELESRTSP